VNPVDPITRLNAALEGRYNIERELGRGGMATVYLADDLKHERKVALKVLKPELAAVVGADRFLAEIKTTANLQHPHILPLHDSGEADGFLYYVMPYVEGETLQDRLDREQQLPVDEAVRIAIDVAEALHAAHEQGVIHRDIKPANILLTRGRPLVADFGIALAVSAAGGGRLTETGLSMGTPFYMSPEQASADREPTAASDVYSLGCVLYEMLVGQPPHTGASAQAVLAKILTGAVPDPKAERGSIPPNVDSAIRRAVERLPADRFASADALVQALADPTFRHGATAATAESLVWRRSAATLGVTTVGLAVALLWALWPSAPAPQLPLRMGLTDLEVRAPGGSGVRLAVSQDGSQIAIASVVDGYSRLFVRRVDERGFRELQGAEGATHPTFSPDGAWVAFSQDGAVNRISTSGGPVLPVFDRGSNAHWGLDDVILIPEGGELFLVSPAGEELSRFDLGEAVELERPFLLPDGEAVVYQDGVAVDSARLMLLDLTSGRIQDLELFGADPQYVATGHLVYGTRDRQLVAVPFDLGSREVIGSPSIVVPQVLVYGGGATQFAVSQTGLALVGVSSEGSTERRQIVIVDETGVSTPLPLEAAYFNSVSMSPDGLKVTYEADGAVGIFDIGSGRHEVFGGGGTARGPFWSNDGEYVHYGFRTGGSDYDGYRRKADGTGEAEVVFDRAGPGFPLSFSPDGTQILFSESSVARGLDLTVATLGPDSVTYRNYLRADWDESHGVLSPNGDRVAYASNQTGLHEVFVRTFPEASEPIQVSDGGGTEPLWARDGSAIYFRDGIRIMKALVSNEPSFRVGSPEVLTEGVWIHGPRVPAWDLHSESESFVLITNPGAEIFDDEIAVSLIEIEVVANWFELLKGVSN
jgi:serine/threonine-protein kinase